MGHNRAGENRKRRLRKATKERARLDRLDSMGRGWTEEQHQAFRKLSDEEFQSRVQKIAADAGYTLTS